MKRQFSSLRTAIVLVLIGITVGGCRLLNVSSVHDLLKARKLSEYYRVEGIVCTRPEEVANPEGVLIGMSFAFAEFGQSCSGETRGIFVSAGRVKVMQRTRKLDVNQQITVSGALEGYENEVFNVSRLVLRRH